MASRTERSRSRRARAHSFPGGKGGLVAGGALVAGGGALLVLGSGSSGSGGGTPGGTTLPGTRNRYTWPFAQLAWPNKPVGSAAQTVPAKLAARTGDAVYADRNPILLDPTAPAIPLQKNGGQSANRCLGTGALGVAARIPRALVVPSVHENMEFAALAADNQSLLEGGQFCVCTAGGVPTAGHVHPCGTITDSALAGASGGSGMSTLAGSIRIGEFMDPTKPVRHVLRGSLCGHTDYFPATTPYRWPATKADGYALTASDPRHYAGTVPGLVPGCLLVIPKSVDITKLSLESVPGQMLAWTLQNYGMRPSNDSGRAMSWNLCTELSPAGDYEMLFQQKWGYAFSGKAATNAWTRDCARLLAQLALVTNDSATAVGGPGTPVQPLAPAFAP